MHPHGGGRSRRRRGHDVDIPEAASRIVPSFDRRAYGSRRPIRSRADEDRRRRIVLGVATFGESLTYDETSWAADAPFHKGGAWPGAPRHGWVVASARACAAAPAPASVARFQQFRTVAKATGPGFSVVGGGAEGFVPLETVRTLAPIPVPWGDRGGVGVSVSAVVAACPVDVVAASVSRGARAGVHCDAPSRGRPVNAAAKGTIATRIFGGDVSPRSRGGAAGGGGVVGGRVASPPRGATWIFRGRVDRGRPASPREKGNGSRRCAAGIFHAADGAKTPPIPRDDLFCGYLAPRRRRYLGETKPVQTDFCRVGLRASRPRSSAVQTRSNVIEENTNARDTENAAQVHSTEAGDPLPRGGPLRLNYPAGVAVGLSVCGKEQKSPDLKGCVRLELVMGAREPVPVQTESEAYFGNL